VAYRKFILAIVALVALVACDRGNRPPGIGSNAPDFTVKDADHSITLSQLRGRTVVLNFWATWCAPCVEEMPSLVQMQKSLKERDVTVLAVSMDEDESAYRRFIKDHRIDLLTVRDPDHKSAMLYGTFRYPETYVIDPKGVVRRKFIGAVDWTGGEIVDYLTKLQGRGAAEIIPTSSAR
jgi:peroxiredoxin